MGSVGSPDIVLHIADGAYSSLSDLSYEEIRDSFEEASYTCVFVCERVCVCLLLIFPCICIYLHVFLFLSDAASRLIIFK